MNLNHAPPARVAPPATVSIITLGCKANQYDSSAIGAIFLASGVEVVEFPCPADAYVINTCTVTFGADAQARTFIRRARKINPEAVIVVTGCYAQAAPDEVIKIGDIDYVLGNPEKGRILEYVLKGRTAGAPAVDVGDYKDGTPFTLRAFSSAGRTRINLKVQDGCNRNCSYCIIPRARGASKSLGLDEVEREIDIIAQKGYKEIILTGIHLGAYGGDLAGKADVTSIVELIGRRRWPCRFRVSSLDPDEVTDEFIEALKDAEKICRHLHLCLQSGDNTVLRRMNRPYTRRQFAGRVEKLASVVKGISIGVDVIAGFPGEGEKEFENTFSLLKDLPVSYLHVFPFSKRRGTPAASFSGQVSGAVIKERCLRLRGLDAQKRTQFHDGFTGKEAEVLLESGRDRKTGLLKGKTGNYITVLVEGPGVASLAGVQPPADELKNSMVKVSLAHYAPYAMKGTLL